MGFVFIGKNKYIYIYIYGYRLFKVPVFFAACEGITYRFEGFRIFVGYWGAMYPMFFTLVPSIVLFPPSSNEYTYLVSNVTTQDGGEPSKKT